MEAIREHRTVPAHHPIDAERDPDAQRLAAGGQNERIRGLDDEVDVVPLRAEMHHPEAGAARDAAERMGHDREGATAAQARHVRSRAQRDVHRVRGPERWPRDVRHARP
ncbi:MAG: hypothetical protein ACJ79R_16910 [Anaeromyxobacteraceae bacterium]